MSLKRLPVDAVWIDRMIALAIGPWDRPTVESRFLEWGWASPAENGRAAVEWGGGSARPHDVDDSAAGIGVRFELGAPPPDPAAAIQLACALAWPAFGGDVVAGGRDDADADYGPVWIRHPDATRVDFHAERDRLLALLCARLGDPDRVAEGRYDSSVAMWQRGANVVVLYTTDEINAYSHYDLLALLICPADSPLADLEGE